MKIFMALALLFLGSTTETFAQYRYERSYPGRWPPQHGNLVIISVALCENHRGTGDLVEESHCFGRVRDNQGRIVRYNPNNVADMEARTRRPILGPYQWGRRYAWNDPRYAWKRNRMDRTERPEPKADQPPQEPSGTAASQKHTFTNVTNCNLLIEKHVIKPGDSFTTSNHNPGVQAFSKTCIPELRDITSEHTNVHCAKKAQTAQQEGR
jgi:hypothetical protein